MNAIGTLLRDPINSGLIRWCMTYNEQADAGRVGRTRLARLNSQVRTGTGKYPFSLFSSPLFSRNDNFTIPVDPYSATCDMMRCDDDHTMNINSERICPANLENPKIMV